MTSRFFLAGRASSVLACGVVGVVGIGAPASAWWVIGTIAVLLAWIVLLFVRIPRRGLTDWLCWLDLALIAVLCLAQPRLVATDALSNGSWIVPLMSTAVIMAQFQLSVMGMVGSVALMAPAFVVGYLNSGGAGAGALVVVITLVVQAVLTRGLVAILRGGSWAADAAIEERTRAIEEATAQSARLAGEREVDRQLHDTVSATLLMVGTAAVPAGDRPQARLRSAAASDLRLLTSGDRHQPEVPELRTAIAAMIAERFGELSVTLDGPVVALPPSVVAAVSQAVGEALGNVRRHSGVRCARVTIGPVAGGATVEISDDGVGFAAEAVKPSARGIRESLAGRMSGVGGAAAIASRPGHGTQVVLSWPAGPDDATGLRAAGLGAAGLGAAGLRAADLGAVAPAAAGPDPGTAALVAGRYARRLDLAVVLVGLVWIGGYDLVSLIATAGQYQTPLTPVLAWLVLLAATVAGSVRLLRVGAARRTPATVAVSWGLVAVGVAAGAVAEFASPPDLLVSGGSWAWGGVGWLAVVVLLRRPLVELLVALAAHHAVMFTVLAGHDMLDRLTIARFTSVVYGTSVLQVAVVAAAAALGVAARRAGESADEQSASQAARRAAAEVHEARRRRYSDLQARVVPLLGDLACGLADPDDPAVQRRCALEAARLRRLFAETDDVPEPLLHELRTTIDVAERGGAIIDLEIAGNLPTMPVQVRRSLLDAPGAAVAMVRDRARVAVLAEPGSVSVSVRAAIARSASAGLGTGKPDGDEQPGGVLTESERDGEVIWVEATWRHR
jgi:signal transduction histidine kinase